MFSWDDRGRSSNSGGRRRDFSWSLSDLSPSFHFLKASLAVSNQYGRSSLNNLLIFLPFSWILSMLFFFFSAELLLQKHLSLLMTCLKCIASCLISIVIMFSLWEPNKRWVISLSLYRDFGFFCSVNHLSGPVRKHMVMCASSKGYGLWLVIGGFRSVLFVSCFKFRCFAIVLLRAIIV